MTETLFDEATAAAYHAEGWWRDRTYLDDFDEVVRTTPDKVAVVAHHHDRPGSPTVLSYRQLGRYVDRVAAGLVGLGVRPGQVVAVQLPNDWLFPTLVLACARVGAVVNPLVPIFRHRELRFMLGRTEAPVCVVPETFRGFGHGAMLDELAAELPTLVHPFVVGRDFERHFLGRRWEDEAPVAARPAPDAPALAPDALAEIQFTSGTTGEPKGVVHTPNTIWSAARTLPEMLGLGPDDTVLMASTLAHQTGFVYGLVLPLSRGMKVVYQDVWDPATFCDLVDDEQVTFTVGATPFVMDAVAACRRRGRGLPSLRWFVCGGAPIPPHLVATAREVVGCELVAVWGMTENGVVTITRPGDPPEVVSSSDGTPVPWMQIQVVDDAGRPAPTGETGRLLVRGANQTPGYYQRPELYAESLTPADDGGAAWFDSGDLAWRREDGGIRISGRSKDLVIRGGENVPVVEVEAVLYTHPQVQEVAVVGYPDERLGERACAVVVVEGEAAPTLADLTAWLDRHGMARQFWPERLEVVAEMPKTPSGKIQKFHLRERLRAPGS